MAANVQLSRQTDILIFDLLTSTALYRDSDLLILSPGMTRVAIEVKSTLDKRQFGESLDNVASVKVLSPHIHCSIFAYGSFGPASLRRHLAARLARNADLKIDPVELPDRIYFLAHDLVVEKAKPGEAYTFRCQQTVDPVIRHLVQDVLARLSVLNFRDYAQAATYAAEVFRL